MSDAFSLATASPAAFRTFWRIAERWALSHHEAAVLLGMDDAQAAQTRAGNLAAVTSDTIVRISHLLAVYKALHALLPGSQANGWVRRPNTAEPFAGAPALERMLSGNVEDLVATRRYLEGQLYR